MSASVQLSQAFHIQLDRLAHLLSTYELGAESAKVREKLSDLGAPSELLVFVVGEGNFGKSSLINALLGQKVADVAVVPKTWRVDAFRQCPGNSAFAEVQRAGVPGVERMSIDKAQEACAAQESATKKGGPTSGQGLTAPKQIIRVEWYRSGLGLPANTVLVDTPGYAQYRQGLNTARTQVLSSGTGVVFDLQEVYENYYHRATVVLWAFRADRIEDRDTQETFRRLCQRGKRILGVVTFIDRVPAERRPDVMKKANDLFGDSVEALVPVCVGEKSSEYGLGLADLTDRIERWSADAEAIKRDEAESFVEFQRKSTASWLVAIGDTLVHNVSQLSMYCNATSQRLLAEASQRQSALWTAFDQHVTVRRTEIWAMIRCWYMENVARQGFLKKLFGMSEEESRRLAQALEDHVRHLARLGDLGEMQQSSLLRIGNYVTAAGLEVAAGYKMHQLVIKSCGEVETRRLKTKIEAPALPVVSALCPRFDIPQAESGITAALRDLWRKLFGGDNDEAEQKAKTLASQVIARLMEQRDNLTEPLPKYVMAVAQAILTSVDSEVKALYPGRTLHQLDEFAKNLDGHLLLLRSQSETAEETSRYQYHALFRIWSPRHDARLAAIDLFTSWFVGEREVIAAGLIGWLKEHLEKGQPLNTASYAGVLTSYLRSHGLYLDMPATRISAISFSGKVGRRGTILERVDPWRRGTVSAIEAKAPFDDTEVQGQILKDYEYFNLQGTGRRFSEWLSRRFSDHLKRQLDTASVGPFSSTDKGALDGMFARWRKPSFAVSALAAGVCGAVIPVSHAPWMNGSSAAGMALAGVAGIEILSVVGFLLLYCGGGWLIKTIMATKRAEPVTDKAGLPATNENQPTEDPLGSVAEPILATVAFSAAILGLVQARQWVFSETPVSLILASTTMAELGFGSVWLGHILGVRRWWRRKCFRDLSSQARDGVHSQINSAAMKSWETTLNSLDRNAATSIVQEMTLVDARPLDYALEGRLDAPQKSTVTAAPM